MKLQHLQTIKTFCQRMSGTWHHDMPQHSAEPITHQALAPSAPIRLPTKLISVTDAFVFSTSAKAWRQRQIKVGVLFGVLLEGLSGKTWLLKCSKKDIQLGKTISIQHPHICWQLNSIRDERWNYSTSKPSNLSLSKDVGDITSWHAAAFASIQQSPPHTRPWRPRHQSGSLPNRWSWRTRLSSVPRPRPGGSDRLRPGQKMTFHWDMSNLSDSKLGKTIQKSTASFSIYIQSHTTMKLQHRQTIQTSHWQRISKTWHHNMPQHSAILWSPPHTRPWRPRRQ